MGRIYITTIILTSVALCVAEVLSFPPPNKTLSAETMPYAQMLHTGTEDGEFYTRGRFGVDFPVIGYDFSDIGLTRNAIFGITAAAHINMLPTNSMKFPVDNFYAALALHISGVYGDALSWRFYPIYHVSAHLADGYRSDIIKEEVRAVSSEMIRGEAYYTLLDNTLELGAGAGWYYHVCAQKKLKARGDVSILVKPEKQLRDKTFIPYALLRGEDVIQDGHNLGAEISTGVMLLKDGRGFGISIRYFNHPHRSYYFNDYEKGVGAEYTFMF